MDEKILETIKFSQYNIGTKIGNFNEKKSEEHSCIVKEGIKSGNFHLRFFFLIL